MENMILLPDIQSVLVHSGYYNFLFLLVSTGAKRVC